MFETPDIDRLLSLSARRCRTALLVLLGIFAAPQTAGGSYQAFSAPQDDQATIRSGVFVVNLFITATSGKEYVRDLRQEDFQVFEDGVLQEIKYFNNLSKSKDMPLTIVMLIDTSASVSDKLQQEIATASAFFRQIIRPNKDMVAVVEFHSEVVLLQDFTDDPDRLDNVLPRLKPGGNTSLYDAVYLAAEEKLSSEAGRKIVVVMSDGEDTASKVKAQAAIKAAQRHDAVIYGLGVRSPQFRADFGTLEKFCRETGGRFFSIDASQESLKRTFDLIMTDINHQYNIAYEPKSQASDGAFRTIKVTAKRKGLKLVHRQGYFSPDR